MKRTNSQILFLNYQSFISQQRSGAGNHPPPSKTLTLEQEVENSVNAYSIKNGYIPHVSKRDELKHILFHNLLTNRKARDELSETINWQKVKFDIATSAKDCLAAYELVYTRYEPLGFNDLTRIDDTDPEAAENCSMISGLTYDEDDKRSVTVIIKGKNQINGTLRLISGESGLLPTEKLYDKQKGLAHVRQQQAKKGKSISEISKLALSENANPMVHYKTLVVSKSLVAKPLNIGNEISLVPKSEFDRRYQRIGFFPELTKRFYHELEEPDVICSWDQDTQLTPYYQSIVLKETRKSNLVNLDEHRRAI